MVKFQKSVGSFAFSRRTVLVGIACLPFPPCAAEAQPSLQEGAVADKVAQLKPGEFFWVPEVAPDGPVLIIVSLESQRAYVYRNGIPIGISTVSTGKAGHATPTGVFTILEKQVKHTSNLYDAPMPLMQRLTWSGVAMHAGNLPGYPASHGCVRLPKAFAKLLFGVTRLGMTVVVTDRADVPRVAPTPTFLAEPTGPTDPSGSMGAITWEPQRSPQGPMSIVISGADKRILVLRNGVVIGVAPVGIASKIVGPSAYTLSAISVDGHHWLQLALPGQSVDTQETVTSLGGGLSLPADFRRSLAEALTPGTTVLITPDTLVGGSTGKKLTVVKDGSK